jgi:N-acetylmuramic acid 6-phosphate etherase
MNATPNGAHATPAARADADLELIRVTAPTEERNPRTHDIDVVPTLEMLALLNAEDALVPPAVGKALPQLAVLVDRAVELVRLGGRVHYFGAGTSGRVAIMDAAELLPTYGLGEETVLAHHAGGDSALSRALESVEDSEQQGELDAAGVAAGDVVVGVAASGRTPYVGGALRHGRRLGAYTALISSNPQAPLEDVADVHILLDTGPEPIAGSTRMKAASAQKLALNSLSTALAIRLGHTYSNLMVDMKATNAKLRGRLVYILEQATGRSESECVQALANSDGELKTALVCLLANCGAAEARERIAHARGIAREAIRAPLP